MGIFLFTIHRKNLKFRQYLTVFERKLYLMKWFFFKLRLQIQFENDKPLLVHSTLKKIEEKLPKELFLKTHRSHIINHQKIIDIEHSSVLIDKKVIPISRTNKTALIRRLNLL